MTNAFSPTSIAIIIADLGAGGAQNVAMRVAKYWQAQGHTVTFITLDDASDDFLTVPDDITRIALDLREDSRTILQRISSNIRRVFTLRKTIKALAPDTVLSFIAPTNILTILATRGLSTRVIISERNDPSRQSFGRIWDILRRRLYGMADLVTANSDIAIETVKSFVKPAKCLMIPNPLTLPTSEDLPPFESRENMILYVGRLHLQKSVHTLITAFAQIAHDYPMWTLNLIGHGTLENDLKKLAENTDIKSKITFEGQQENPATYYARASIFVLPSLYEGTPNALLEALSWGIPSIASTTIKSADALLESSAERFTTGDVDDLSQKLRTLIEDESLRRDLSQSAPARVRNFDAPKVLKLWDTCLKA